MCRISVWVLLLLSDKDETQSAAFIRTAKLRRQQLFDPSSTPYQIIIPSCNRSYDQLWRYEYIVFANTLKSTPSKLYITTHCSLFNKYIIHRRFSFFGLNHPLTIFKYSQVKSVSYLNCRFVDNNIVMHNQVNLDRKYRITLGRLSLMRTLRYQYESMYI